MARIGNTERARLFGPPGDRSYLQTVTTPWGIRVPVHEKIAGVFLDACRCAERGAWNPQRIDSFNPRPIRGSTQWSIHSWALAFDFFATPPNVPPPGGVWTPHNGVPPEFAKCFTDRGFTWGSTFSRKDVPHIEWAGPPPSQTGGLMPGDADRIIERLGKYEQDTRKYTDARIDALENELKLAFSDLVGALEDGTVNRDRLGKHAKRWFDEVNPPPT